MAIITVFGYALIRVNGETHERCSFIGSRSDVIQHGNIVVYTYEMDSCGHLQISTSVSGLTINFKHTVGWLEMYYPSGVLVSQKGETCFQWWASQRMSEFQDPRHEMCRCAQVAGADFSGADFSRVDCSGGSFSKVDFSEVDVSKVNFSKAYFSEENFRIKECQRYQRLTALGVVTPRRLHWRV